MSLKDPLGRTQTINQPYFILYDLRHTRHLVLSLTALYFYRIGPRFEFYWLWKLAASSYSTQLFSFQIWLEFAFALFKKNFPHFGENSYFLKPKTKNVEFLRITEKTQKWHIYYSEAVIKKLYSCSALFYPTFYYFNWVGCFCPKKSVRKGFCGLNWIR